MTPINQTYEINDKYIVFFKIIEIFLQSESYVLRVDG